MCGISGIASLKGPTDLVVPSALLMNSKIRHRGPDGEGLLAWNGHDAPTCLFTIDTPTEIIDADLPWTPKTSSRQYQGYAQLALAHRRLAIIDLESTGHQPTMYSNGELWMTYNGEIYNYIELRAELEAKGHRFITQSDNEVILAAYKQWGQNCVQHFNGMWAFVIWDRIANMLFCSRDRFGVKPFYYYRDKNYFVFASELKALAACPVVHTSLNHQAVADYFVDGEIEYKPNGFFQNILELFPGTNLLVYLDTRKLELRQWYTLTFNDGAGEFSGNRLEKEIETVRELLIEAIRIRLRSDVPVGACLSGGIDSSAISGIIATLVRQDKNINVGDRLKLFTASFEGQSIDESKWAKLVADETSADWLKVTPEPGELLNDLEDLIYSQDIPIWSTSTYAQHRVMRLASQNGIRVLLDGQGGDELFAGYMPYYIPFWKELKKNGNVLRRQAEMRAWGSEVVRHHRKETLKQYIIPSLPVSMQMYLQKKYFPDLAYLSPDLIAQYKSGYNSERSPDTLNEALHREFVNTRLKGYLKCEDRCSMWHSVESRTPFADDHKLIEHVFSIPGTMKIRSGVSKYILRQAAAPFMPEAIRKRKDKMGYVTPNNTWITGMKEQLRPYFDQDFHGIIRKEKLMREYNSFFNIDGKPENGRIFKFMAFAIWKKVYRM
jgi:asparagine synthase (glutamine-hydrolysing)